MIYPYRNIRRAPDVEVPTGEAVTTTPSPKKVINAVPKVDMPKAVPDNIKKMTFSVSDFDTEQLPTTPPVTVEDTKTGVVTEAKESSTTPELNTDGTIKADTRERNSDGTFKETKAAPTKEPKVEPKVEPSPILKPPVGKVEPTVKPGKEKVTTIGLPTKTQRDYSGFADNEVAALKQMSNEGFELASRVLKENRELKKLEGSTYLQHEHAYVLDPEFQQKNLVVQRSSGEAEHWRQQLILAEQGKPIHDIKGWNQQGHLVEGQEYQPNASLIESVRERLYACNNAAAQNRQSLEQFPQKYSERIKQDSQAIEHEIKSRFAWEQDPKLMDHTLNIEFEDGPRDVSLKQIKEDFTSLFPAYLRQNLGVRVAANMMIALKIQDAELRQLKAGAQVTQIQQEERRLVEPTSEHKIAPALGKPVNGVTEFGGDPV